MLSSGRGWLLALICCFLVSGCSDDAGSGSQTDTSAESDVAAAEASIDLQLVDRDGLEAVVAAAKDKVVLVDVWATWCKPCTSRFPETARWAGLYEDKGLQIVTLSLDAPGDQEKAKQFLQSHPAPFVNLVADYGTSEAIEEFNVRGGIPFYKLYDRTGKLRFEFNADPASGQRTEALDQIEMRMLQLLRE